MVRQKPASPAKHVFPGKLIIVPDAFPSPTQIYRLSEMHSPYSSLPAKCFWKTGVEKCSAFDIKDLYQKKFEIRGRRIATAGSCFAQHISSHLRRRPGYEVLDMEPPPAHMSLATAKRFGYSLYSARYGNIYLARQFLQLLHEVQGTFEPADAVWEKNGRYFDAMRPSVEPDGLSSISEVKAHRAKHLLRVRELLSQTEIIVFTFGLTEGWIHRPSGTVYPTAPGTIAGSFDSDTHALKNFSASEVKEDFVSALREMRKLNPRLQAILTVSPVPLTATAVDRHVLISSTYSKAVLRAVAGEIADSDPDVDYFPSFELIGTPVSRGMFYSPNLRTVEKSGVEAAMKVFFSQHQPPQDSIEPPVTTAASGDIDNAVCEEALLEAFGEARN